jgi:hypothetical protein
MRVFSFDHLVGAHQERRRHVEAERLCRLQVEDRFVFELGGVSGCARALRQGYRQKFLNLSGASSV